MRKGYISHLIFGLTKINYEVMQQNCQRIGRDAQMRSGTFANISHSY